MKILISFFFGLLISLIFPPYFFLPLGLIFFPFICFFVDTKSNSLKKINFFIYCFFSSFGFFLSFIFWIQNPFFVFEETKQYIFLVIFLIVIFSFILSVLITYVAYNLKFIPITFLIPLILSFYEFILSNFIYGFPWLSFSLAISGNDRLLLLINNYGTLITSYLVLQFFCLPYLFFEKFKFSSNTIIFLNFLFLPLIIVLIVNSSYMKKNNSLEKNINVELFQLNFKNNLNDSNLNDRLKKISNNIINSSSDILIFAENNFPLIINDKNLEILKYSLKKDQVLIIGGTRLEKSKYYNTLVNIKNNQISYFDKKILVPFGEFLPLRSFFTFLEYFSGPNDYNVGDKKRIIKINNNISYIPVICYEIIFYWKLVDNINLNSDLIINITNDIWFGKYLGPYQHFYHSKLRAAEIGKPLIRVSNNGISAIFNENGSNLISTKLNEEKNIKYLLNANSKKNFYKTHNYLKLYYMILFSFLILKFFRKIDIR